MALRVSISTSELPSEVGMWARYYEDRDEILTAFHTWGKSGNFSFVGDRSWAGK